MKTNLKYRLALIISFILYTGVIIAATGCVSESSRNLNIVDVPRQTPGETTPVNVQNSSPFDRSKESYRIYSAILDHKWNNGSIVVRDHTDRGLFQNDEWLENNVDKSYPDAASDFKAANEKGVEIENRFDYNGKVSLIDQQEFRKTIDGGDGWDAFRAGFEGALFVDLKRELQPQRKAA